MLKRLRDAITPPSQRTPSAEEIAREIVHLSAMKVSEVVPTWKEGKPVEPSTNFVSLVKGGWRRNELIFACSSRKASTASQVALKVHKKVSGDEVPNHPLRELIKFPNPRMSEFDFLSSIFIFQDFGGIAYYEKVRSRAGKVVQLWPMRPDWVRPLPSSKSYVAGYEYGPPGEKKEILPAEDVLSFPLWDPLDEYRGFPPVAVAARVADVDNSITDYIRLMFQEGGVPPGLLKTKQAIDDAIAIRMREKWKERYGGVGNWLEPAVLGYDLEYQQIGLGLKEMGLEMLDKRNETRICMVMKVPPTMISTLVGLERAILSNAQEFQKDWWVNDLIPMYKNLNDNFQNQLVKPDFGDDVELKWDFHDVPALINMYKDKKEAALNAFQAGAITRNQYLAECGLPELGPRGEVFVMSMSMQEVPANKILVPRPIFTSKPVAETPKEDEDGKTEPKSMKAIVKSEVVAGNAPDNEERLKAEKLMARKLRDFFSDELSRIRSSVTASHRPLVKEDPPTFNLTVHNHPGDAPRVDVEELRGELTALKQDAPTIIVNVEPTPVSVANNNVIQVPENPPAEITFSPEVNVVTPKAKKERQTIKRDHEGNIASTETDIEY